MLNKKRASIEALQARLAARDDLNDVQMEKIQALAGVPEELEELLEGPIHPKVEPVLKLGVECPLNFTS